MNSKKASDLQFGLSRESDVIQKLNKYFNDVIIISKQHYSRWDCIGTKHFYEIKCLRYNIEKYPTCVINTDKNIFTDNLVLVFQYSEMNYEQLYYIQFDKSLFDTFQTRFITPTYRSKPNLIYDIPKDKLIKIEMNTMTKVTLKYSETDYERKIYLKYQYLDNLT